MIILIGIAGSGKTTQGQLLAKSLDCPWLSTGQLIRDGKVDPVTAEKIQHGQLLPDEKMVPILEAELSARSADKKELVLDGFPRTLPQAKWLIEQAVDKKIMLTAVVHLIVSKQTVKKRLQLRGRADDEDEAIKLRFSKYQKETLPIIKYFKAQNITVHEIDGEDSEGQIAQAIARALSIK